MQKKKKISIMCLDLQPPTQITILSPVAYKNPSALAFQMSYPLSMSNIPPSKLCIVLFIFVYLLPHVSMLPSFHSSDCSKAHIQRCFTLHAAWNGTPVTLYCFPCSLSLLSSSLSLPLSLLFLFSLPPFLSIFLPSLLSFFFKFRDT